MARAFKQPSEELAFAYDFGAVDIQTIDAVASTPRAGGANLVEVLPRTSGGGVVTITWDGGDSGETYATSVKITDTSGQEREVDGEILVFNTTFVLPTGIASLYLTGEQYVDRFGYEETVRTTDELKRGAIDGPALLAALADAQQFADGYLGTRYSLPITAPAPELLRGIIADLARERLHKTRPTPQVTANADRARSLLKDLSAGRAVLPTSTGAVVEEATGYGSPAWTYGQDASVFNADKLERF